jgi:hypothetical protein
MNVFGSRAPQSSADAARIDPAQYATITRAQAQQASEIHGVLIWPSAGSHSSWGKGLCWSFTIHGNSGAGWSVKTCNYRTHVIRYIYKATEQEVFDVAMEVAGDPERTCFSTKGDYPVQALDAPAAPPVIDPIASMHAPPVAAAAPGAGNEMREVEVHSLMIARNIFEKADNEFKLFDEDLQTTVYADFCDFETRCICEVKKFKTRTDAVGQVCNYRRLFSGIYSIHKPDIRMSIHLFDVGEFHAAFDAFAADSAEMGITVTREPADSLFY